MRKLRSIKRTPYRFGFPKNTPVPKLLAALAGFTTELDGFFSNGFELTTDDARAWFDGNTKAARQLAVFGRDPDGSLYALWLYPGRSVDDAPIVYLNSENDGNGLVADKFEDFLALLALDIGELGFWVESEPWAADAIAEKSDEPSPELARYRRWLREQCRRTVPSVKSADRMTRAARARHPAFDAWVRKQLGESEPAPPPATPKHDPNESSVVSLELKASRDAFDAGVASFLGALTKQRPDLSVRSSSRHVGVVGRRTERFHKTRKLPETLKGISELRVEYTKRGKQALCLLIVPRPSHIEAALWMTPHPEISAENQRARSAFDQHVGGSGKVLKRRGNAA